MPALGGTSGGARLAVSAATMPKITSTAPKSCTPDRHLVEHHPGHDRRGDGLRHAQEGRYGWLRGWRARPTRARTGSPCPSTTIHTTEGPERYLRARRTGPGARRDRRAAPTRRTRAAEGRSRTPPAAVKVHAARLERVAPAQPVLAGRGSRWRVTPPPPGRRSPRRPSSVRPDHTSATTPSPTRQRAERDPDPWAHRFVADEADPHGDDAPGPSTRGAARSRPAGARWPRSRATGPGRSRRCPPPRGTRSRDAGPGAMPDAAPPTTSEEADRRARRAQLHQPGLGEPRLAAPPCSRCR